MKVLVETTSSIMLVDPLSGDVLPWNRPAVMRWTTFLDTRTGLGQVKVLANEIPDDATDEDWEGFWNDSDQEKDLAVASFMSAVKPEPKPAPKKAAPKRQSKKQAEE